MRMFQVRCDVEIRAHDEDDHEIDVSDQDAADVEKALYIEIEGLQEMDFDLDIKVTNMDVEEVRIIPDQPIPIQEEHGRFGVVN